MKKKEKQRGVGGEGSGESELVQSTSSEIPILSEFNTQVKTSRGGGWETTLADKIMCVLQRGCSLD